MMIDLTTTNRRRATGSAISVFQILLLLILTAASLVAQSPWQPVDESVAQRPGDRRITPKTAAYFSADTLSLKQLLWSAPHEQDVTAEESPVLLDLPRPDGERARFRIVAYHASEAAGLQRFPGIRTWYGVNTEDAGQTVFLDWTARGFHASVRFGQGKAYNVDPLFREEVDYYQAYFKGDYEVAMDFACSTAPDELVAGNEPESVAAVGDCHLREYQTAITATGEYSNYHGATSSADAALVQSAIVTTLNRVNQVFTRDLALRLVLVGNNSNAYHYDPDTDPFDGTSPGACLTANTGHLNSVIGSANYDLGHIFSAGFSSGVAYLRSTCGGNKGGGVTGRSTPEGDPFDVDYVAHEMGHQLGGNHTQNNSCNYNSNAGMEPGSASTIMGYAGICSPNVQSNSDAYFHGRNLQEIGNHLELGNGNGCASVVSMALNNPVFVPATDEVIPQGTPFRLVGNASGNGNLDYCWEQYDHEQGPMPPVGSSTQGPLFRSYFPTADNVRYLPRLESVLAGTDPEWEEIPTVTRNMDFLLSVRNYNANYGCAQDDRVNIDVDGTKGPFVVLDPNQGNQYSSGQTIQVLWDVAGTDQAPVNSNLVDILFSVLGDENFILLAGNLPNTGYATITLPAVTTTMGRLMVRSADNVFYNVSNQDITVVSSAGSPQVTLENLGDDMIADCFTENNTATFEFLTSSSGGATLPLDFTVPGLPDGVTASFSPNPVYPGGAVNLILSGLDQLPDGNNTFNINGTSNEAALFASVVINKVAGPAGPGPGIISPVSGASGTDLRPRFMVAENGSDSYTIQVARDVNFQNLVFVNTSTTPEWTLAEYLEGETRYYWRVRSQLGSCGDSQWREDSFITGSCFVYTSTAAPVTIGSGPPPVQATMDLNIPDGGDVLDLDVFQLNVQHTYVRDLVISLTAPSGTQATLFDRECGSENNIAISLDDDDAMAPLPCPPVNPGLFIASPQDPLSTFDGESVTGNWRLTVDDLFENDGGSIEGFQLKVCLADFSPLPVSLLEFTAKAQDDAIVLDWTTSEELDNYGFFLERSQTTDLRAADWKEIAFLPAVSTPAGRYRHVDETVEMGIFYYYRLRQQDLDGTVHYSDIRAASLEGQRSPQLSFSPVPAGERVKVNWLSPPSGAADYQLLDTHGRLLGQGSLAATGHYLELAHLPPGIYLIRVDQTDRVDLYRIVKQ